MVLISNIAHAIVPGIYANMQNKRDFAKCSKTSYLMAWVFYMVLGSLGYLMFGYNVDSEVVSYNKITKSISNAKFNWILSQFTLWLIALNPLTKYGLMLTPVNSQFEQTFPQLNKKLAKCIISFFAILFSILIPSFTKIMGLLGCTFSFFIAVIFPLACHMKINELKSVEYIASLFVMILGVSLAIFGTACVFAQLHELDFLRSN
jgi:vesicular inhibitory amino acid transporter